MCLQVKGQPPLPRASHAAAMLDGAWYVVGGGDNTRALCDMTTLQLPPDLAAPEAILRWRGEDGPGGEEEDGPRGEGLALVAARPVGGEAGCLVTLGGYNGQAGTGTGAVHVMVPGPLMDIAEALRQVKQNRINQTQQTVAALLTPAGGT